MDIQCSLNIGLANKAMHEKKYEEAVDLYTQAIETCPAGKNSHIYFCNRAAAKCYLEDYTAAIVDCENAIQLDTRYSKAYSRLGFAYMQLVSIRAWSSSYLHPLSEFRFTLRVRRTLKYFFTVR